MKLLAVRLLFFCICGILPLSKSSAQIIDVANPISYKKVFVETDDFDVTYLKDLEEAYPKIKIDTIKFSVLNDLAYYWHTRNLTKANKFTQEGLRLTRDKKNKLWEGRFQITQGAILLRKEKLDSAILVLESAKNKVLKEDLPLLNTQLGYVFERRGQLDKAADYALETLKLGEDLNDTWAKAMAYSDLSNLLWKQSKFNIGVEYGLQSLQLFESRGIEDLDYDFTLYVVGNNYLALKQYDTALNYYNKAMRIGERYGFYNNLSDIYISLVDLYAYLHRFEEANSAGEKAIRYAELLDNEFMLMRSWLSVGKLQYKEGKFKSAIESLETCITIATKDFGDEFFLSQAYEALGKSYAGNHNYKEAYQAFAEYDKLKNQIFTAEADKRISLLQTEFDVAEKDNTIQFQENKINQQRTRQTLITIIAVLLAMLLIVFYKAIQSNKKKNKLLQQQNSEKEFLLKEIHHRVKNNLEIVSSLLSLQSSQVNDPLIKKAMLESQSRVLTMSMIHQRLYQGKNLDTIEMKDYFINLGQYIIETFGAVDKVVLECNMNEIELDVDTAVPLGLIVNELLTNSLKYAFPNEATGKINISLYFDEDSQLTLKVADNGIGFNSVEIKQNKGFGTHLIQLLTQQLNGKVTQIPSKGTVLEFVFYKNKVA